MDEEHLDLCEGKYTFIQNADGSNLRCLRYGKEWRDFVGDKAVAALFTRAVETKVELDAANDCISEVFQPLLKRAIELIDTNSFAFCLDKYCTHKTCDFAKAKSFLDEYNENEKY